MQRWRGTRSPVELFCINLSARHNQLARAVFIIPHMKTSHALPALFCAIANISHAANWPQFRGPDGEAKSDDKNVPLKWSETENMKWKLDLPGAGSSSPIVWGNRIFVICFSGEKENGDVSSLIRSVVCVDSTNGKKLWQIDYPAPQPEDPWQGMMREHGYASNTPVTDGKAVYAQLGKGGVVALDFSGKELWRAETGKDSNMRRWGSAGSLILWKNLLIVNASSEALALFAFDKDTGKQIWKQSASLLELAFGTPRILKRKDGREEILFAAPGELWGMIPETGKLRWYAETGLTGNITPDAVMVDDLICVFGGYPGIGRIAVHAGDKGEVPASNILWRDASSTYVPTPVALDGKLYCVNDAGLAWCVDAKTGKMLYRERAGSGDSEGGGRGRGMGKPFYASPIIMNGNIFAVSRKQGTMVIAAKPEFQLLGVNVIAGDNTDFNATPAVSDGHIYLRSNKALYCIGK